MPCEPAICVVIPVFNHGLTVGRIVREAREFFPVIVVNDGSTDDTGKILAGESGVTVITLPRNQGKGAALRAGLARAEECGFTHAITMDADGQHATRELPWFGAASRERPEAFVIGVRNLVKENAPVGRRISNSLSTFWFKVETGVKLTDTQCGYRSYPLQPINRLRLNSQRYAYELEVMVKAAWAGIPLRAQRVSADYASATSRLSHFHPVRDMVRLSLLHSRLSIQSFCVPALLRKLSATGQLHHLPRGRRVKTIFRLLFSEHTDTPAKLAFAVGLGFFCGIAPIWGFQIMAAAALAHKLRLNKAIAVTASHISFPLATPFIMAGGLLLGHYLHTGGVLPLNATTLLKEIPIRFTEWFFGSIALGILAGIAGTIVTWLVSRWFVGRNSAPT
jgi:glycosyltransferase involved in cell wall biosynthesis